jgi:hypothetical protein
MTVYVCVCAWVYPRSRARVIFTKLFEYHAIRGISTTHLLLSYNPQWQCRGRRSMWFGSNSSIAYAPVPKEYYTFIFPMARQPLGVLRRFIFRGFTITLFRHTTLGRTPLDEGPARRRELYLTTHNTHKRQTSMPSEGFEPTIPVSERPQTYALEHAATGIGTIYYTLTK